MHHDGDDIKTLTHPHTQISTHEGMLVGRLGSENSSGGRSSSIILLSSSSCGVVSSYTA